MPRHDIAVRQGREPALFDPFREFRSLPGFSDIIEDFFGGGPALRSTPRAWAPRVDIEETEGEYVISAALPGVKKEDLRINAEGDMLTISGERKEEREEKGRTYLRREMFSGQFIRSFPLPYGVHPEDVKARFADGVLTVTLPKPKEAKSRSVSVKVD